MRSQTIFLTSLVLLCGCGYSCGPGDDFMTTPPDTRATYAASDFDVSPASGPFGTVVTVRSLTGVSLVGAKISLGWDAIEPSTIEATSLQFVIPPFLEGTAIDLTVLDAAPVALPAFHATWRVPEFLFALATKIESLTETSAGTLVLYTDQATPPARRAAFFARSSDSVGTPQALPIALADDLFVLPSGTGGFEGLQVKAKKMTRVSALNDSSTEVELPVSIADVASNMAWAGDALPEKSVWILRAGGAQRIGVPNGVALRAPVPLPVGFVASPVISSDSSGVLYVRGSISDTPAIYRLTPVGAEFERLPDLGGELKEWFVGKLPIVRRLDADGVHDVSWSAELGAWSDKGLEVQECDGTRFVRDESIACIGRNGTLARDLRDAKVELAIGGPWSDGAPLAVTRDNGQVVLFAVYKSAIGAAVEDNTQAQ